MYKNPDLVSNNLFKVTDQFVGSKPFKNSSNFLYFFPDFKTIFTYSQYGMAIRQNSQIWNGYALYATKNHYDIGFSQLNVHYLEKNKKVKLDELYQISKCNTQFFYLEQKPGIFYLITNSMIYEGNNIILWKFFQTVQIAKFIKKAQKETLLTHELKEVRKFIKSKINT